MKPLILTYTGRELNPLFMGPEDVCIEDIAHALACCNRFAGHTKRPISVAQHSVYVSRLVGGWERPTDGPEALQGLLHDGSEAYLGDITKWLKAQPEYAAYRTAEDHVQRTVYQRFGCQTEMYPNVAKADKLILRFEGEQGFGMRLWDKWLKNYTTYTLVTQAEEQEIGNWSPWSWRQAEEAFLTRFRLLTHA